MQLKKLIVILFYFYKTNVTNVLKKSNPTLSSGSHSKLPILGKKNSPFLTPGYGIRERERETTPCSRRLETDCL